MNLPHFLVIGAAKSGTTALHHFMAQHPEICLPRVKETNFFAFEGKELAFTGPLDIETLTQSPIVQTVTELERYTELFQPSGRQHVLGEVCPSYLYYGHAVERIAHHVPDVRLVAILRDPVDRAFSAFQMLVETGREPLWEFEAALAQEPERIARGWEHAWHYVGMSRYGQQLARYIERFGRTQLLVILYEDYVRDPAATMAEVFRFIGVDPTVSVDASSRHNTSGMPQSRLVETLIRHPVVRTVARAIVPARMRIAVGSAIHRANLAPARPSPEAARFIRQALRSDLSRLEQLIGRDLGAWRAGGTR